MNVYNYLLWRRSPKECDVFYEVKYFLVQGVRINPTYKHQNEHYNYFHFSFCKTTLSLFYECVFCYLLQKIFVIVSSHLLYTVCIARLSEGQSGQTVTCGQKVDMQTTFSDFSHFLQNSPQNWMEILFFNQENLFSETHGREVEFGELNSVNCVERTVRLPETAFDYHSLCYCNLKCFSTP